MGNYHQTYEKYARTIIVYDTQNLISQAKF